jgi:hypothetical protein
MNIEQIWQRLAPVAYLPTVLNLVHIPLQVISCLVLFYFIC